MLICIASVSANDLDIETNNDLVSTDVDDDSLMVNNENSHLLKDNGLDDSNLNDDSSLGSDSTLDDDSSLGSDSTLDDDSSLDVSSTLTTDSNSNLENNSSSSLKSRVGVKKLRTSLSIRNSNFFLGKNNFLTVYLKDQNGKSLSKRAIYFTLNEQTSRVTTDSRGQAKIKLPSELGNYLYQLRFKADSRYYGSSLNQEVNINKMPTKITVSNIGGGKYTFSLKDNDGKALSNHSLSINIPSEESKTIITNSSGMAVFNFRGIDSDNATVEFDGDDTCDASSLFVKLDHSMDDEISISDVVGSACAFRNYFNANGALPTNISYDGYNFTTAELSYLMAHAIKRIDIGSNETITYLPVSAPLESIGDIYEAVYRKDYVIMADNVLNSIELNMMPSYVNHTINQVPYDIYTLMFSRILNFYNNNAYLPNYGLFTMADFIKANDTGKYTFYLTSNRIGNESDEKDMLKNLSLALNSIGYEAVIVGIGPDIHNMACWYGCKGNNSVLLACFGGVDVGCIEQWAGDLEDDFMKNYDGAHVLGLWYTKPYGASVSLFDYVGRAWDADYGFPLDNPAEYMEQHNISYIEADSIETACEFLKAGIMGGPQLIDVPDIGYENVSLDDIIGAARVLKNYVGENNELPLNVTYNDNTFSTPELSYLMAKAIDNIKNDNADEMVESIVITGPAKSEGEIYDTVYQEDYLNISSTVLENIKINMMPSSINYSIYQVPYDVYTLMFSKILNFYGNNNCLPNYCLFTMADFVKANDTGKYTFYLTSENIKDKSSDLAMLKNLSYTLNSIGYEAIIVGIGPDIHNMAFNFGCKGNNSVLLACFYHVDVGSIEMWTGDLGDYFVNNYAGAHVLGLWYTEPYGNSTSLNETTDKLPDADYGFLLENPAQYMEDHNISYMETGTVESACELLQNGTMGGPQLIEVLLKP